MSIVDTDYACIFYKILFRIVLLTRSRLLNTFPIWFQGFVWRMKGREMTPEERAQRKKERAEIELRRKVNREVRKRKLVPAEDAEKKAPKKKVKATANTKKPAATTKSAKGKGKTKGVPRLPLQLERQSHLAPTLAMSPSQPRMGGATSPRASTRWLGYLGSQDAHRSCTSSN